MLRLRGFGTTQLRPLRVVAEVRDETTGNAGEWPEWPWHLHFSGLGVVSPAFLAHRCPFIPLLFGSFHRRKDQICGTLAARRGVARRPFAGSHFAGRAGGPWQ